MTLIDELHRRLIYSRRTQVLAEHLSHLIPSNAAVLDIGCGDGIVSQKLAKIRNDVRISGVEVRLRAKTSIPVTQYDGIQLSFPQGSFDAAMLIDVLHHTVDPAVLLREAHRVSRRTVLIKDHLLEGILAASTLRFMDRVGNSRYGVFLPCNYWTRQQWNKAFMDEGLQVECWTEKLKLYWPPFSWIFDRSLHFVARLNVAGTPKCQ